MDGISSLLGTPKMNKIEMENRELRATIQNLSDENKNMEALNNHYVQRDEELVKENNGLKYAISKLSK